jgi:4-hydroxy-4-methyl-2-oxoglutarate aldolase
MKPTIVRSIPRPREGLCEALASLGVATVHESYNQRGLMDPRMRPIGLGHSICGPAITALNHPGDNMMIHAALATCRPGDVLVATTTSPSVGVLLGENLATCAAAQGAVGAVVDGAVRDTRDLRAMGFPVWSSAISASGAVRRTAGWVNVPLVCGGVTVHPGDLVVADDDGVVVVARHEAEAVLEAAQAKADGEARTIERYRAGELSIDIWNLHPILEEQGVRYVDSLDELDGQVH